MKYIKRPLLIEVDKAQAEWVIVAHLANDPNMLKIIQDKEDAHAATGSLISGIPIATVKTESELLSHLTDPVLLKQSREKEFPGLLESVTGFIPRNMTIRQMGKKGNHGLDYDMSVRRFSLENETPERESKRIVEGYHNGYPNIRQTFYPAVRRELETYNRVITNCFGRKRRFLGQWGNDLFKEAYAHIPQSTVADLINKAFCLIYAEEVPRNTFKLLTQVHDSILLEAYYTTEEELWDNLHRILIYMDPALNYNNIEFHIGTDCKAGYSWGSQSMKTLSLDDMSKFSIELRELEEAA